MIPEEKYLRQAEEAWEQALDIYLNERDWVIQGGSNKCHGCVHSKKITGKGKTFKLEARLDSSPQEVFQVLVPGVNDWPKWNPTILECKSIQTLSENTDISYSVGAAAAGGMVSSRDFVNLRHWKTRQGITMSSACAVTHPDMPPSNKHIRAENRPACYVFKPVPGEPSKCQFTCILSTDLKGWLPQFLIDKALSGVLLDYLKHLRNYLLERHTRGL